MDGPPANLTAVAASAAPAAASVAPSTAGNGARLVGDQVVARARAAWHGAWRLVAARTGLLPLPRRLRGHLSTFRWEAIV